ncbi:hypothetical protein L7F22_068484 [Adiantum nelumboides]|nr:hypothetical protein [Adiantum nelumboides]
MASIIELFSIILKSFWKLWFPVFLCILGFLPLYVVIEIWWQPRRIRFALSKQGVHGPPSAGVISGHLPNIFALRASAVAQDMPSITHDIVPRIYPHMCIWTKLYGNTFVFMWGPEVRLAVADPDVLRDILSPKNGQIWGKSPVMISPLLDIVGKGLIWSEGDMWVERRRIFAPAFHMENLKGLTGLMQQCADSLVEGWYNKEGDQVKEIEMHKEFIKYSADVISSTEFGSSFESAMRIFEQLGEIEKLLQKGMPYMWIPGHRYFPTRARLQIWRIQQEIKQSLEELVNARKEKMKQGLSGDKGPHVSGLAQDMLGLMLAKVDEYPNRYTIDWVMDEIKTFFIAAHETTALMLTWTMMLLASNPSWQERLRTEVYEVCPSDVLPTSEALGKLKLMTMVLKESLRLYTPVPTVARKLLKETKLGHLIVPEGCGIFISLCYIHHSKELWGKDADEFKPERFNEGIACNHPMGFLPFSFGGRNCIGQSFAILEAKIVLLSILKRFRFQLSPSYRHAPVSSVTLYPKHGMQILVEPLHHQQHF